MVNRDAKGAVTRLRFPVTRKPFYAEFIVPRLSPTEGANIGTRALCVPSPPLGIRKILKTQRHPEKGVRKILIPSGLQAKSWKQ